MNASEPEVKVIVRMVQPNRDVLMEILEDHFAPLVASHSMWVAEPKQFFGILADRILRNWPGSATESMRSAYENAERDKREIASLYKSEQQTLQRVSDLEEEVRELRNEIRHLT
jgi:hypothetical protein